jgi:D-glycero-alpha-D-manno-heptose 1-phosphate guanylyltransferase
MEAIILAGGLGTRLSSRLTNTPKSMAPVAGRPFITFLLDQLISAGFDRVILSVGHLRQALMEELKDTYRGMPIDYAIEASPLGTGGGIRRALQQVRDEAALVLNGDTYLSADFSAMMAFHRANGRPMTMAITQVEDTGRYGGVLVENQRVCGLIEKGRRGPGWINAGAYVLDRGFSWPESLPERFSFETDVLSPFLDRLSPAAFIYNGYFLDIGIPEDLDRAERELSNLSA